MAPAGGGGSGGASGFMPHTKDPGVISVRLLLDGMEDADADALKAENVLSDYEVLQLAKHISISFRSTCVVRPP
ncbi:hypothetical protein EON66_03330 [archaeon]|nr:MAG: hypothetical protein EON66_03330 [archaeon]